MMKKNKEQTAMENLSTILHKNTVPPIQEDLRKQHLQQLCREADSMDICGQQSFVEQILTQVNYLSRPIWLIQAGFLGMLFYCTWRKEIYSVQALLMLLAPCLTLILLYEISKSFGKDMWELEASCRYNLQHIFAIRLCALSGIDLITLTASLIAFRISGGVLWEFALYLLLPFFLMSSICLQILRKAGNRCSFFSLSAVALLGSYAFIPLKAFISTCQITFLQTAFQKCVCIATLAALFCFIYSMAALCMNKQSESMTLNADI